MTVEANAQVPGHRLELAQADHGGRLVDSQQVLHGQDDSFPLLLLQRALLRMPVPERLRVDPHRGWRSLRPPHLAAARRFHLLPLVLRQADHQRGPVLEGEQDCEFARLGCN